MIEAAEAVQSFIDGRTLADMTTDRMLRLAVERAIEIIGEAAGKVSPETRQAMTSVPWSLIVGMRNRLVHAYFDSDTGILWKTAAAELPFLLLQLRALPEADA